MTRQIVRLDSNNVQQSINLEFDAEILSVINPTAQSIGISVGGNIPPQTVQSADIWIPADSGINYPVVGRNFAAAFMPPLLVNAPTGIPTAANLFFTAQEAVPNFGAFPLSTLAIQSLADVTLRAYAPLPTLAGNSFDIAITPDIQSITILIDVSNVGNLQVPFSITGKQSGILYLSSTVPAVFTLESITSFPVFAGLDTALTFVAGSNAPHSVSMGVIGHRYIVDKSSNNDQLQTVRVYNAGSSASPVPLMVSTQQVAGAPVGVNPTWLHAPDFLARNSSFAPTVGTKIVQITSLVAGTYHIVGDLTVLDTYAVSVYTVLVVGATWQTLIPSRDGVTHIDIPAIALGTGDNLYWQQANGNAGAGSLYLGSLAAYKL